MVADGKPHRIAPTAPAFSRALSPSVLRAHLSGACVLRSSFLQAFFLEARVRKRARLGPDLDDPPMFLT